MVVGLEAGWLVGVGMVGGVGWWQGVRVVGVGGIRVGGYVCVKG